MLHGKAFSESLSPCFGWPFVFLFSLDSIVVESLDSFAGTAFSAIKVLTWCVIVDI